MPSFADEIRSLWPSGPALPTGVDRDVAIVEQYLGEHWLVARLTEARARPGRLAPLVRIFDLAQKLPVIAALPGSKIILRKLRRDDGSAFAEVTAVYALSRCPGAEVNLFPKIVVQGVTKTPDFCVRRDGEVWTYVEVSRPAAPDFATELTHDLRAIAERILDAPPSPYVLEVDLLRQPTHLEVDELVAKAHSMIVDGGPCHARSDNIGALYFNWPDVFEGSGPPAAVAYKLERDNPARQVAVRLPIDDHRAARHLDEEAKQLPPDFPSLVVLDLSNVTNAVAACGDLFTRYFAERQPERPSGAALMVPSIARSEDSFAILHHLSASRNPYARKWLPSWIPDQLRALGQPATQLFQGRRVRFWE